MKVITKRILSIFLPILLVFYYWEYLIACGYLNIICTLFFISHLLIFSFVPKNINSRTKSYSIILIMLLLISTAFVVQYKIAEHTLKFINLEKHVKELSFCAEKRSKMPAQSFGDMSCLPDTGKHKNEFALAFFMLLLSCSFLINIIQIPLQNTLNIKEGERGNLSNGSMNADRNKIGNEGDRNIIIQNSKGNINIIQNQQNVIQGQEKD